MCMPDRLLGSIAGRGISTEAGVSCVVGRPSRADDNCSDREAGIQLPQPLGAHSLV